MNQHLLGLDRNHHHCLYQQSKIDKTLNKFKLSFDNIMDCRLYTSFLFTRG